VPPPTAENAPPPAPAPTVAQPPAAPAPAARDGAATGAAPAAEAAKPTVAAGTAPDGGGKPPAVTDKGAALPSPADREKEASAEKEKEKEKAAQKEDEDEPDEEALLRDAVPNAETAVIGEDEAETPARPTGRAGAKPPAPPKRPASEGRPAKVQTAVLHISTAPRGAIVKTKARVLGRTPIDLHFKSGNTYELVFVKRGYQPATRKVAVQGSKDRKVAVTLKKRPAKPAHKASFFHPHR
jgi:hypothetical protein